MRNARTIAKAVVCVWPLGRPADGLRMSVVTRGPNFQLQAELIRRARV